MNDIHTNVRQWYDVTQQALARVRARVKIATDAHELAAAQAQALAAVAQALARLLDLLHDIDDGVFRTGVEVDEVFTAEPTAVDAERRRKLMGTTREQSLRRDYLPASRGDEPLNP